jgi:hypothetical protein
MEIRSKAKVKRQKAKIGEQVIAILQQKSIYYAIPYFKQGEKYESSIN